MKFLKAMEINDNHIFNKVNRVKSSTFSKPFRVTWKDLTYSVPHPTAGNGVSKVILNGVSGYFDSGKVTAIMGPSGGGKSTLLACISKQKSRGITGSITITTDAEVSLIADIFNLLTISVTKLFRKKSSTCKILIKDT